MNIQATTPGAAIVTGASRGLGVGIARRLAHAGYPVVLAARSHDELERAVHSIGGAALAVPTDVTVDADVDRLIDAARERFGKIDVVVNNAGAPPVLESLDTLTWDRWKLGIDVDVHGTFATTRAVAPLMGAQAGGTIVNVVGALGGKPTSPPHLSFSPAQAAQLTLSRCSATLLEPAGVVVHTLFPGLTPAGGIGRTAAPALGVEFGEVTLTADHVGDAVVQLLSERHSGEWRVGTGGLSREAGESA